MRVTLEVKDSKATAFVNFIKSLDFVRIENESDSKEEIVANLREGFQELRRYKEGKLKAKPLKNLLNEL